MEIMSISNESKKITQKRLDFTAISTHSKSGVDGVLHAEELCCVILVGLVITRSAGTDWLREKSVGLFVDDEEVAWRERFDSFNRNGSSNSCAAVAL